MQLLDVKTEGECRLNKRRVRWEGATFLPQGHCNTLYVLVDLDTGEEVQAAAETFVEPKDW